MITEDYVSYETAKLLKEKGFDEGCSFVVNIISKGVMPVSWPTTNSDIEDEEACLIALPTLQMAMKWLREAHNLCLEPYRTACGYLCDVARVPSGSEIYGQEYEGDDEASGQFTTYEKSCEAAIKYCLENLI